MIISFGWTTPALLEGQKTVTRREWNPKHAAHFKAGMLADAWNTSPRNVRGNPHKVATIRLTVAPFCSYATDVEDEDWYAEGFQYLTDHGLTVGKETPTGIFKRWQHSPDLTLYVVRFEVVEYLEGPLASPALHRAAIEKLASL